MKITIFTLNFRFAYYVGLPEFLFKNPTLNNNDVKMFELQYIYLQFEL